MKDIKYVQLEPAAFLTDIDFQLMDAEQRGVYCSIIFYLYSNGGSLDLDNTDISLLEDGSSKLASISGCYKSGAEWRDIWKKIAPKFQINGNIITHKRVTIELKKAERLFLSRSHKGKNHPNWKGGPKCPSEILKQIRNQHEYTIWRKAVFHKNNYTCQNCNERGSRLEAHHIKYFSKYPELRFIVSNGLTLCKKCHKQLHKEVRKCLRDE